MLTRMMTEIACRVAAAAALWARGHRSRAALARMTAHQLQDVGLTPGQTRFEAALPFWQP